MNVAIAVENKDITQRIVSNNGAKNAKIVFVMIMTKETALKSAIDVVPLVIFQEIALKVLLKYVLPVKKEVTSQNIVVVL